jgi:acyl carrier protein
MAEDAETRVKRVLMDEFGVAEDKVTPDALLIEDLGMGDGQLNVVEFTIRMEEEFGISLPDDLMDHVKTVRDLTQCVIRHL